MKNRRVTIETGELQGIFGYDPRITVFKGIPYAAPPVGELRWKAPQPAEKWEGVKVADHYMPMACQPHPGVNPDEFWSREIHPTGAEYEMNEDCLYLNVFTPAKTGNEKLPVLYYIHGGGYKGGYPYEVEFDWEHMARKGIVVVAVTYRLGVMGFLATSELLAEEPDTAKGNYGLQDQLYGLRWVKRNIAAFGGDPDKVTIAGQSAGAGSVQCLISAPAAEGFVSGAIIQSGITAEFGDTFEALSPLPLEKALSIGDEFFAKLGVKSLEEARNIPGKELVRLEDELLQPGIHFQPVVDNVLLFETPFNAYKNNHHLRIPVLAGYNLGETRGFMRMWEKLPETLEELKVFAKKYGEHEVAFLDICKAENDEDVKALFDSDGFTNLIAGTRLFGYLQSEQNRECYLYEFNPDIPGEDNPGSFHGCELWFAYDSLARCWRPFIGKHYDLARQTSSYWVNFVKTGNPNGTDTFGNALPEWKSFSVESQFVMGFTDAPEEMSTNTDDVMKFRMDFALGRL